MGVQTPCLHLPFFPYLHTEVLRSWKNPYSALVDTQRSSTYSMVVGTCEQGYGPMPKMAGMVVGSPSSVSSWRKPALPTKPCRVTSAYVTEGQAGTSLHTMAVLQVYQADLLRVLDHSKGLGPEVVQELCPGHRSCPPGNQADAPHYWLFYGCYGWYGEASVA